MERDDYTPDRPLYSDTLARFGPNAPEDCPAFAFMPDERSVGYFEVLPKYHWHVTTKPNWFHRLMMRWLLGWKWSDK